MDPINVAQLHMLKCSQNLQFASLATIGLIFEQVLLFDTCSFPKLHSSEASSMQTQSFHEAYRSRGNLFAL